jgi:hypothetical protein
MWIALCVCFVLGPWLGLRFAFFAGFKQDSPRFFRGPSWLSPTDPLFLSFDKVTWRPPLPPLRRGDPLPPL